MPQLVTITSKRQMTIPAELFRRFNLQTGQQLLAYSEDRAIKLEPAMSLVEKLAGSVKLPKRYQKQPLEKIISQAKHKRFNKK